MANRVSFSEQTIKTVPFFLVRFQLFCVMRVGRTVRLSASGYNSQQQCNRFFLVVVVIILLGIIPYYLYVSQVTLSNVNTALENIAPHIHEVAGILFIKHDFIKK